jgi:elongation factor Ts
VADVAAGLVKQLREKTGAGIMDCKQALQATGNDVARAVDWLREKGLASAARKAGRAASEGGVFSYIHAGGRVGVLLEMNCETDFVAMTPDFQALAKDLALQIAAAAPRWVRREDVPAEVLDHERRVLRRQALAEGKPERIVEKMVEGRLSKFYSENCLLEQPFIKDEDQTVGQRVQEAIAKLGENLVPRRFARFQLGEADGGAEGAVQ